MRPQLVIARIQLLRGKGVKKELSCGDLRKNPGSGDVWKATSL